jgi:hypothetical protein
MISLLTNVDTKIKPQSAKCILNSASDHDSFWSCEKKLPQSITIDFERDCFLDSFSIQFSGGFVANSIQVGTSQTLNEFVAIGDILKVENSNDVQLFRLPECSGQYFRLTFLESTDFYERIIIYKLSVFGSSS